MRALVPLVAFVLTACGGSTTPDRDTAIDTADTIPSSDTTDALDTALTPEADATPDATDAIDTDIPPGDEPTSQELIHQALIDGRIDSDTALVYRVFAAFSDERLPTPYRGRPGHDSLVGAELIARYADLSPEHRAAVHPFTLPPPAEGSWWALRDAQSEWPDDAPPHLLPPPTCLSPFSERGPWIPLDSEHFRVWSSQRWGADVGGRASAAVLEALEDYLWPLLSGLMQSTPVSDDGLPCNGNDGRLDIYVLRHLGEYGSPLTMPFPTDCHQPRATYIVLHAHDDVEALLATTAHELLHALQFSFPVLGECIDYLGGPVWFTEGTALWAEGYAYPSQKDNPRTVLSGGMWATPFDGLSSDVATYAHYRSYPFWKHLTEVHEDPDLIRQLFEALAAFPEHGDALAHILPRGLALDFLDFAVKLLNEPPDLAWHSWLGLEGRPATTDVFPQLDGRGAIATSIGAMSVDAFGVRYWHIEPEDDARLLFLDNPIAEMQVPGLALHAVRKLADGTLAAPLDWTAIDTPVLCRDDPNDDFASLYLTLTWADPKKVHGQVTAARPGRLVVASTPCHALSGHSEVSIAMNGQVGDFAVSTEERVSATFSFTRAGLDAEGGQVAIEFVPAGSLTWSMSSLVVGASDPPFSASCPAGPVDANILHEHGTLGFVIGEDGQALWFANGRIPIGPLPWTDCFGEPSTMVSNPHWLYVGDQLLPFEGASSLTDSLRRDGLDASWRLTPGTP